MKKTVSVFLISALLFGIVSTAISYAAPSNSIDADKFATEVSAMICAAEEQNLLPGTNVNDISEHNKFKTARLIVKSKNKIDTQNAISVISGFENLWILQFKNPEDASKAYNYYSTRSGIEFVEADTEITAFSTKVTPVELNAEEKEYLSWGAKHIGMDVLNQDIINKNISLSTTVVAVIDTGVDPNHPFLEDRVIPTKINTSTSGIRNDSTDDAGHGTQVAGVIADCTLDNVYIKPYKVLDKHGNGTTISVAAGINCAIRDEVDVINISVGFEENSEFLRDAILNAEQNDITVVSSAGNDGTDTLFYPASYSSVLKISAINEKNVIANFSTYGADVDFSAPGVDIITTSLFNKYTKVSGTSFSSPFVSSIIATIIAIDKNISTEEIKEILIAGAIEVNELDSRIKSGYGLIHAPEIKNDEIIGKNKVSEPTFSHNSAVYKQEIDLEIFCDTPNAIIYYTTDRTVPSKTNPSAIIYDGKPIQISQTSVINAVAYCDGYYRSSVGNFSAIVAPMVNESDLSVDSNGRLLSYNGTALSISVPETVNGITVKSVGNSAFKNSNLTEILLPDSVTEIEGSAFESSKSLKTVRALNAVEIGEKAFYDCVTLRNFYLGELTSIGAYSFYNVCSNQYLLSERTFMLKLQKLSSIPEGAFMNSAISAVELDIISTIGKDAFSGCQALVNINIKDLTILPDGAFKGCSSLIKSEIYKLTYVSKGAFSTCESLKQINIPDATIINSNAFENCISLLNVSLDSAEIVYSNAFNGCTSLRTLYLPSMKEFEPIIYGSETTPLFPKSLEIFDAPKLQKIVPNMFVYAPDIRTIRLNSIEEIPAYAFRNCHNIFNLNIENVKNLGTSSLSECTINFIDARSLVSTEDMPDNSGILLSNQFIEATDLATNLTVYGTPNTFVEYYSLHKGYKFVPIPLIYSNVPEYITENSETVYITAVGFDLKYQWYWNTVKSTDGGTPIEGATSNAYTFTDDDTAPFYYCTITQNDRNIISTICTDIITKDTVPADYSAYNKAFNEANSIDRTKFEDLTALDEALKVDVSNRYSCEQDIVDKQTEAILNALENLKFKKAKSISLYSSNTELRIFESVKVLAVVHPTDAIYSNVVWSTQNPDVVIVSKNGNVRCIGDGTAIICATVDNIDGTQTEGRISIECDLTTFEKIVGKIFKYIFIINDYIQRNNIF